MKQLLIGIFLCLSIYSINSISATYDERKAEQLKQNREIRQANERRYEACSRRCFDVCKSKGE